MSTLFILLSVYSFVYIAPCERQVLITCSRSLRSLCSLALKICILILLPAPKWLPLTTRPHPPVGNLFLSDHDSQPPI